MYLSNLTEAKGFMDVLAAAPLIRERIPDVHFILAGEWTFKREMDDARAWIEGNHLHSVIHMPGVVAAEKVELLLSSDVFVFPPRQAEGQPVVILEAMAAGLPVVTTDRGAIAETVLEGVTGFIVPARDPRMIANRVSQLLEDHELRLRMGRAGRKRVEERYSLRRWGSDIGRLFQQVLCEG
jgi:glycosyltransferase involved in cell wall biosynthesis